MTIKTNWPSICTIKLDCEFSKFIIIYFIIGTFKPAIKNIQLHLMKTISQNLLDLELLTALAALRAFKAVILT